MRKIDCPVPAEELRRLYLDDKLADPAIVERLGAGATLKRVRAWRKRFGIETISPSERNYVPPIEGSLRSLLVGSMLGDGGLNRQPNSTRYMENHANNQKEYLEWKQAQWGSWDQVGIKPVTWVLKGQSFAGWRFATVCHPSLNEWHALFYGGATGSARSLIVLTNGVTNNFLEILLDTNNRVSLIHRSEATAIVAQATAQFAAEPVGTRMNLRYVWDSTQAVDVSTRFAVLYKNNEKIATWATDPTAAWDSFFPTLIYVGVGSVATGGDFNGTVDKVQVGTA